MRRGFQKNADLKPHLVRYWLTPAPDERLDEKVEDINTLYRQAQALTERGKGSCLRMS
jgi:hypothetical protein